jgi:hypothetical protein
MSPLHPKRAGGAKVRKIASLKPATGSELVQFGARLPAQPYDWNAISGAFVGPPPTDIPIAVFTEPMSTEGWLESWRRSEADPEWAKDRGGTFFAFVGMLEAKRVRVADRPIA